MRSDDSTLGTSVLSGNGTTFLVDNAICAGGSEQWYDHFETSPLIQASQGSLQWGHVSSMLWQTFVPCATERAIRGVVGNMI